MPDLKHEINWRYQHAAWRVLQAINKATAPRQQAKYAFVASAALALATAVDPNLAQTVHPALTGTAALLGGESWGKFLGDIADGDALTDEAILDRLQQLLPLDRADDILNNQAEILQQITQLEAWESLLVTIKENDARLAQQLTDQLGIINQKLDHISANMATRQQVEELRQTLTQPKPTIPLQLPPRATHFTGRQEELVKLLDSLHPGRIVTLVGPGGIGKTALAAEAIHTLITNNQLPTRFPNGIAYYSFSGRPSIVQAAAEIVHQFSEDPNPDPLLAAARILGRRTALLVLDSAEEAEDDRLSDLLNLRSNCGVLITSYNRSDIYGIVIDVSPLPIKNSMTLLKAWGKQWANDETATRAICELVGNLALAVRLVGAYLHQRHKFAAEYLEWLRASPLQALDFAQRRDKSIPILLQEIVTQLSPEALSALAIIGCLALAPIDITPIATALDLSKRQSLDVLGELVIFSLLNRNSDFYELTHSLLHTYARERLAVTREQLQRLGEYFVRLAASETKHGLEGHRVLDGVRPHIMALFEHLQKAELWQTVNNLAWAIQSYLDIQGHWLNRVTVLEAGLIASQKTHNLYDQAAHMGHIGLTHYSLGQFEQAIDNFHKSLRISRNIGERRAEGIWLGNLGSAYHSLGQFEKAINFLQQSLSISRALKDRLAECKCLSNLGYAYHSLEDIEMAIKLHIQALDISRTTRDFDHLQAEGIILGNLGDIYSRSGQLDKAENHMQEALSIRYIVGDRLGQGVDLLNLGEVSVKQGKPDKAAAYYQQALIIFEEIKSPYAEQARQALEDLRSGTED